MHKDEREINIELVQKLLAEHFPSWAHLPLEPVSSSGTDNALYRLGKEMVVRLSRIGWAVDAIEKELLWLLSRRRWKRRKPGVRCIRPAN